MRRKPNQSNRAASHRSDHRGDRRLAPITLLIPLCAMLVLFTLSPILAETAQAEPNGQGIAAAETSPNRLVYVVPVHDTIDHGLWKFMERAFREAEEVGAHYVILDIDTFGGYVDAAMKIGPMIQRLSVPTAAFIHGHAFSAGTYIALSADEIIMQDGAVIGAAAMVDSQGNRVTDSKQISAWVTAMRAAAQQSGRNPLYAEGMVDDQIIVEVPELGVTYGKGELISFSAQEAAAAGYAEHITRDLNGVLDYLGVSGYTIVEMEMSMAEKAGRILTNPYVQIILLIIGIAGVIIEMLVPGFGLPGILGIAGFALYFFGNYVFGFAGVEHIALFVGGIILMLIELFVPSFGVLGALGIIALGSGVVLSANKTGQALQSLGIAVLAAAVIIVIVVRIFKHRGIWNRFILSDKLDKESGYVSNVEQTELLGATGVASSVLRPSGTAVIDGQKYDVVTNGEFIPANTPIKVIHVEGMRIVVSAWQEDES